MWQTKNIYGLVLILLTMSCDTADNVRPLYENYFMKYYGKDGEQSGVDLVVNPDGTMVLLGNSVSPAEEATAYIVKVDGHGNVLWQRQCGGANEAAIDLELIKKGAYAGQLVLVTNIGAEADSRIRVIRIDQNGNSIDSVQIESNTKQVARGITALEMGEGYVITGNTSGAFTDDPNILPEDDVEDILALRLDEQLQTAEYVLMQGGEHYGSGIKVLEGMLGNQPTYFTFGYSDRPLITSSNLYEFNFEVIATRSGTQVYTNQAGTENNVQIAAAVIKSPPALGEGYVMMGTSRSSGINDLYFAKFTPALDAKREQRISLGTSLECVAVAPASDGYVALANELNLSGNRNIFLVKLGVNASVAWTKSFGTPEGDDSGGAVASLPDGRIAVLGTMELETQKKMVLLMLNKEGLIF